MVSRVSRTTRRAARDTGSVMLGPSQPSFYPARRFGSEHHLAVLRRGQPRLPAVRHLPDRVHRGACSERRVQDGGRLRCWLPLLQCGPGVLLPARGEEGRHELERPAGAEADPRRHSAVRDPVEHGFLRQHLRRGFGESHREGLLRRDRIKRGQMRSLTLTLTLTLTRTRTLTLTLTRTRTPTRWINARRCRSRAPTSRSSCR
jgi:hypothetical protein